jgi:hypothetical protein
MVSAPRAGLATSQRGPPSGPPSRLTLILRAADRPITPLEWTKLIYESASTREKLPFGAPGFSLPIVASPAPHEFCDPSPKFRDFPDRVLVSGSVLRVLAAQALGPRLPLNLLRG